MKEEGKKAECESFLLGKKKLMYGQTDGLTDRRTQSPFVGAIEQFATWEIIKTKIHKSTHENHHSV